MEFCFASLAAGPAESRKTASYCVTAVLENRVLEGDQM